MGFCPGCPHPAVGRDDAMALPPGSLISLRCEAPSCARDHDPTALPFSPGFVFTMNSPLCFLESPFKVNLTAGRHKEYLKQT